MNQTITHVDWNAFNYIFSGNTREAFQKLAEQLFCFEFEQPYGIYRYYNQPYIETMPISHNEDIIGFQAKYYDASTNLSSRKDELKNAITGASEKYPELTKIVFYINKEAGISSTADRTTPAYILEIETHGKSLGIDVEWRLLNQMETMLLKPELEIIKDYFFSTGNGIRKTIEQIAIHSSNIWNSIYSSITYNDTEIKVSRSFYSIDEFINSDYEVLLIHGEGGSGKSGFSKDILNSTSVPVWAFRATDFNTTTVNDFAKRFGDYPFNELLSAFSVNETKICYIDSAEKLFNIEHQDTFKDVFSKLKQLNWKFVISIRTEYKDIFLNTFLNLSETHELYIQKLNDDELASVEKANDIKFPDEVKLKDILHNLFYLKLYLYTFSKASSKTAEEFKKNIWNMVICDNSHQEKSLNTRRGNTIIKLVSSNVKNGSSYYICSDNDDWDAFDALKKSEIISYDDVVNAYFLTHDVYEEIVLKYILNQEYHRRTDCQSFFTNISDGIVMRKAFRLWIHDKIIDEDSTIIDFIKKVFSDSNISPIWKDEILIAMMSENDISYSKILDDILKQNSFALFFRTLILTNTACRKVNVQLCKQLLTQEEINSYNIYRFTRPSGAGWNYLIKYTYENRENIPWNTSTIMLTVNILSAWTVDVSTGETTRLAGLLALYFYNLMEGSERKFILNEEHRSKLMSVILNSSLEILSELNEIFETTLTEKAFNYNNPYTPLCRHLLQDAFTCGKMPSANPTLVCQLAEGFWLKSDTVVEKNVFRRPYDNLYGLSDYVEHDFYPTSAFQTPIFPLLQSNPKIAIDFIINFFNKTSSNYKENSELYEYKNCYDLTITFPNGDTVTQICNQQLWQLHRGFLSGPNLLESILMALERWFMFYIPQMSEKTANLWCIYILKQSKSVALTSVIVSICTAFPDKLFDTACVLLTAKEIFDLDIVRFVNENMSNIVRGLIPRMKIFDDERIASNNLPHRKKRLEEIIFMYQISDGTFSEDETIQHSKKIHSIIDDFFTKSNDEDENEKMLLYRMDIRKMKLVTIPNDNQVALVSNLPKEMEMKRQKQEQVSLEREKDTQLYLWATDRYKRNDNYKKFSQYEQDPVLALKSAISMQKKEESLFLDKSVLIYVAAVILRDFYSDVNTETIEKCEKVIIDFIENIVEVRPFFQAGNGCDAAISMLPEMIDCDNEKISRRNPIILLLLLLLHNDEHQKYAAYYFREKFEKIQSTLAKNLIQAYINLKFKYNQASHKYENDLSKKFVNANKKAIKKLLFDETNKNITISSNLDDNDLITLSLILPPNSPITYNVALEIGERLWSNLFEAKNPYSRSNSSKELQNTNEYIQWLANYLLELEDDKSLNILKNISTKLNTSNATESLLSELIIEQCKKSDSRKFWVLWNELFNPIKKLCDDCKDKVLNNHKTYDERYYGGKLNEIITTYLLAFSRWNDNAHSWESLNQENAEFFRTVATNIGYHPATIYSISKVLNTIGYDFLNEGIEWFAIIVRNNKHLWENPLPVNTEYYLEEYMQRFISSHKQEMKLNREMRHDVFDVLNFLVHRGSTCAFMLREELC